MLSLLHLYFISFVFSVLVGVYFSMFNMEPVGDFSIWIYISLRSQNVGFLERKCQQTGCLYSVMLESDFSAAVVTEKKLTEVVKYKHQSFFFFFFLSYI